MLWSLLSAISGMNSFYGWALPNKNWPQIFEIALEKKSNVKAGFCQCLATSCRLTHVMFGFLLGLWNHLPYKTRKSYYFQSKMRERNVKLKVKVLYLANQTNLTWTHSAYQAETDKVEVVDTVRVARFFLMQSTKMGIMFQMPTKYTKMPWNKSNGHTV
jgi:hypothetical protein